MRPILVSAATLVLYLVIDHRRARSGLSAAWRVVDSIPASRAFGVAGLLWTLAAGTLFGTYVAGGADSYGYVSQAQLFTQPALTAPLEVEPAFTWQHVRSTLTPLAYVLTPDGTAIAPTYPPGLPLLMAVVHPLGERMIYFVVPACGALLVGCLWLAGVRLGDPLAGGIAAALLALSPTFLFQLVQPMSDVPAAALWLAAVLGVTRARSSGVAGGIFTGLAILVRPNLAPLALVVGFLLLRDPASRVRRLAAFAVPVAGAVAALVLIHDVRFGSPLASGYGPLDQLFGWDQVPVNARQFAAWINASHTPFVWLAVAAPVLRFRGRSRPLFGGLLLLAVGTWIAHLPYVAFRPDEWHYTRFLLLPIAVMLLFATLALLAAVRCLAPAARVVIATGIIVAVGALMMDQAVRRGAFELRHLERRYPLAGAFVRDRLPPRTYVLAVQHSGSIRLYSGRPTLRWDHIDPLELDMVVRTLRDSGYVPALVADASELREFRVRFESARAAAALIPVGEVGETRIYRLE